MEQLFNDAGGEYIGLVAINLRVTSTSPGEL
jgi:hypothetical protein